MPERFSITCSQGSYQVQVKTGCAQKLLEEFPSAHVVWDECLKASLALKSTQFSLPVTANEESKEFAAIESYIRTLRGARLTRGGQIVAIGGGVIQDISGFLASVYMRGIPWHYAPSTLLGMLDSCIGGKSSINAAGTKNLVGTYYPPKTIRIDPLFLETLQQEQIIDGLCEAVKICFAHPDEQYFERYKTIPCLASLTLEQYEQLITLALHSKQWFIEKDEFDKNERLLLNFGHTFGHALETASGYGISHGIAVGVGMLCAIALQEEQSPLSARTLWLRDHTRALLAKVSAATACLQDVKAEAVLNAFQTDKKHSVIHYAVIVPNTQGMLEKIALPRGEAEQALLSRAIQKGITLHG